MSNALVDTVNTLSFLHDPGDVFELCIIGPKTPKSNLWEGHAGGKKPIVAGWFKKPEAAAKLAVQIEAEGIYTTLNPCQEALLARADHRLKAHVDRTADHHVTGIRNLLIDIDPQRPTGVSSTDQEHATALEMAQVIKADLTKEGWGEPMVGDSGNGGHLTFPLDLPNGPESVALLKAVLEALAMRYANELARRNLEIDQKVFNPARLTKLYGTWTRKGDNTPTRPHRLAQILSLPETRQPVPLDLLKKLAATVQTQGAQAEAKEPGTKEGRFDVEAYLTHYGVEVVKVKPYRGGMLYCLRECLFDPSHSDNEAAIGQAADGKLFYQCFHNSCKGRTWTEARQKISGGAKLTEFIVGGGDGASRTSRTPKSPAPDSARAAQPATGAEIDRGLKLTDWGNAERLVALHGQDLRYCHPWKKWLVWDGRRWAIDETAEVQRRAKSTVSSIYGEAAAARDQKVREALAHHALRSESEEKRKAMVASAWSESGIPILPENLDWDPWLLNVLNGTIDLRTGELRPHSRSDFITKLAPVHFDPKAECPLWWKFLERILPGEMIEFVQKAVGYSATGLTVEQVFFLLYGLGDNGKTVFLETIGGILGDYTKQTDPETFMLKKYSSIPNDLAALKGARFVKSVETSGGRRMSEARIKQITGQDTVPARFLHAEWFNFKPEFKMWLATNHKPIIRDPTHAMWRRVRFIPFEVQIPKEQQDKRLFEKLKPEWPGILNSMVVEGALLWQHEGLEPPGRIKQATQDYREEMDILGMWITECCVVAPGASDLATELYKSYLRCVEGNKEKNPLSQTAFGISLTARGFERKKTSDGIIIRQGIGLKPDKM